MKSILLSSDCFNCLSENVYISLNDCNTSLKEIKDCSIDCILTDPPYFLENMGADWNDGKIKKRAAMSKAMPSLPAGSKFDPEQGIKLQKFLEPIAAEFLRILKPGGFLLCFSQGRLYHRMALAFEEAGFEIRDLYTWYRDNQTKARAFSQEHFVRKMDITDGEKEKIIKDLDGRKTPQLRSTSEAIVMAQKPKEGTYIDNWTKYHIGLIDVSHSLDGSFPGTVMKADKPTYKERDGCSHPTMKPVLLLEHLIKIFTPEGAVICDPFMGIDEVLCLCS